MPDLIAPETLNEMRMIRRDARLILIVAIFIGGIIYLFSNPLRHGR